MRQNPDFIARPIAGQLMLVPIARDAVSLEGILTLNEVGARIWDLLAECRDEAEIACRLAEEYEVDQPQALQDVRELIGQLRQMNAVLDD
ncbi:MAG: PqqD family protein [Armatimonadetes bacterium]|nr:PqqD family protein [Armatimonadota bacterium]